MINNPSHLGNYVTADTGSIGSAVVLTPAEHRITVDYGYEPGQATGEGIRRYEPFDLGWGSLFCFKRAVAPPGRLTEEPPDRTADVGALVRDSV